MQVVEKKNNPDFLKGQAFNARYHLRTTTQQNSDNGSFFALGKMFKSFFGTEKVEVKRPNQLPIFLLHNKFCLTNQDKVKNYDK